MFLIFVAAFQFSTRITQHSLIPILQNNQVNSWFVEGESAFTDWDNSKVRQFHSMNRNTYTVNITIRVQSNSTLYPFIQESIQLGLPEVDEITYTLLPKQEYQIVIEYNCSTETENELQEINLLVSEQSFKNNHTQLDELNLASIRYYKYCKNPQIKVFTFGNFFILVVLNIILLLIGFLSKRILKHQIKLSLNTQILTFILFPILGAYSTNILNILYFSQIIQYILGAILLYDIFEIIRSMILKIIAIIVILGLHFYFNDPIIPYALSFISLIQINKYIKISNHSQLFIFIAFIWASELYSLSQVHKQDSHLIQKERQIEQELFINTYTQFHEEDNWTYKIFQIHLYQLQALSLITTFLMKKKYLPIGNIIGILIFQHQSLNKQICPFLSIVTLLNLLVMLIQYLFQPEINEYNDEDQEKLKI